MGRSFRVTGIRVEPSANETHDHVAGIRQGTNPQVIGRALIVNDLRDPNGDRYYVETAVGQNADLVIADCPICSFPEYLRSTADRNTADSLLALTRV
jgi:hypothetical protein